MKNNILIIGCLFLISALHAQEILYYLHDDFEDPVKRALWTSTPPDATIYWKFQNGGGTSLPPGDYQVTGSTNAFFKWYDFSGPVSRTLVSPPIDLSDARRPQLIFAHAQHNYLTYQDEMYVVFRAGASANWDTIAHYPTKIYPWTERFFNIEDYGTKYLVEDFQLGFIGVGKGGNGVCIDSVVVEEKDVIQKFVRKFQVSQMPHSLLPSGIEDVPIIKIYIEVFGNSGTQVLNSITFNSSGTADTDFPTDAFSLFLTQTNEFKNKADGISTKVGPSVSINSGMVTFTGLNKTLYTGDNYLWLTADIANSALHGNIVDFLLQANSVNISDSLLPSVVQNPTGSATINESVLYNNFETTAGWTLQGDFEMNAPQGFTINLAKEPNFAYSGNNILGTDLTVDGGYSMGITPATSYYAITPIIDLKYFKNVKLYAQKWLSFNYDDDITIDVSVDSGNNWKSIWDRKVDFITGLAESSWSEFIISNKLNDIVATKSNVVLRFAMNETSPTYVLGGWNIDNFAIVGNHLDKDVGITQIFSPYNDCIGKFNDTVKVVVRNYAEGPTPANIPIYYTLNGSGGTRYYDTIEDPIAQNDSIVFTFSRNAGFPNPGNFEIFVSTELNGDEDALNNTILFPVFIQNSVKVPFYENFETVGGSWLCSEESQWGCIIPSGGVPVLPESPHSWFVAPSSLYLNSDTSWVISSCYDLVSEDKLVLELKYWCESEAGVDGANIQYSVDEGLTWTTLTNSVFGDYSGWYSNVVNALGEKGWSGNTTIWKTAREYLPVSLQTEPNVKFRVYWAADAANATGRGIVFDDFSVYPAPPDIGVSSIIEPLDACPELNSGSVVVNVTNFGVNKLRSGDTINVGIQLDSNPAIYESSILTADLLPGNSIQLSFDANLDLSVSKAYALSVFTLNEDDPDFYSAISNDTAEKSFNIWTNPVIFLADTIGTRQPDTLVLRPQFIPDLPGNTYLWQDNSTADTIKVSEEGIYKVKVTEPVHNCVSSDSVLVLLLFFDAGADSILSPISACSLSNNELITIQVRNMGTDSLLVGDKIAVSYSVNGGTAALDTITLTQVLRSNRTINHSFTDHPYNFSTPASYSLTISASYIGGDKVSSNNSITRSISVYGYTPLNMGPDLTIQALDYTLDAGSGFKSYTWNTGANTQTLYTGTSGTYWVHATDNNNCPAGDTISIWFKIRDIQTIALLSPISSCTDVLSDIVRMRVRNTGTDTIPVGTQLNFIYQVNGGTIVTEDTIITFAILPGVNYEYEFKTNVNLIGLPLYRFYYAVATSGDLHPANDSLSTTLYINDNPVVDLGGDRVINGYQYVLDAGPGENYSYQWQDNSTTTQTFIAETDGFYSCIVTNTLSGCTGGDTVHLTFDISDYAIQSVNISNQVCQGPKSNVAVGVLNNGNLIRQNANLNIAFSINNTDTIVQNFVVTSIWVPGSTTTVQLTGPMEFQTLGTNSLRVFLFEQNDLNPTNDQLVRTISVLQAPVVNFGGDTLQVNLPYQLDAGNHETYQWQDNSVNRYYTVTSPGNYSVTVTNAANCVTIQSVYIESLTGINDNLSDDAIRLYPNPVNDFLTLTYFGIDKLNLTISITDISGRLVWFGDGITLNKYGYTIDLGELLSGTYFISIQSNNYISVKTIIIQ